MSSGTAFVDTFCVRLKVFIFLKAVRSTSLAILSSASSIHTSIGALPEPVAVVKEAAEFSKKS